MQVNRYVKTALKVIAWIAGSLVVLLLLIALLLMVPEVQNMLSQKAVHYLSGKLHTKVELKRLRIIFPESVSLEDIYIEDQKKDTLLYGHRLQVNISMLKLLSGKIDVGKIALDGITAHVYRTLPDTAFNFNFIVAAFSDSSASQEAAPADSSAPLNISLGNISLKNIYCTYRDQVTGMDVSLRLDSFRTRITKFDMSAQDYGIGELFLSGLQAAVLQTKPLVPADTSRDTTTFAYPQLSMGACMLENIQASYNDSTAGLKADVNLGRLDLRPRKIDLPHQRISIRSLALQNTRSAVELYASPYADTVAVPENDSAASSEAGWTATVDEIKLDSNDLKFDNQLQKPTHDGMDYSHLDVENLQLEVKKLSYSPDSTAAQISQFSFLEKNSGFHLKTFRTDARYSGQGADLDHLLLVTDNSMLQKHLAVSYDSLGMFATHPEKMGMLADLDSCVIDMRDVLCFAPFLKENEYVKKLTAARFFLSGSVKGALNDFSIPALRMTTGSSTLLQASGRIKGLPDMDRAYFDMKLPAFTTSARDLQAMLPDSLLPSDIRLPDRLALQGSYTGSLKSFQTNARIRSSMGNILLQANMSGPKGNEKYEAKLAIDTLNIGRLLKQDSLMGTVTLNAAVQGSGLDKKTAAVKMQAMLQQLYFHGYDYRDLKITGDYQQQAWNLHGYTSDPNVRLDLLTTGSLAGEYPEAKLNLRLDSINLQALHLSDDLLKFHGNIEADFPTADIDYLNGHLYATDFQVVKNESLFMLDSIRLTAEANDTINRIDLQSEFADASVYGKYKLSTVGDLISRQVNRYFAAPDSTVAPQNDTLPPATLAFNMQLHEPTVLKKLVPALSDFADASIRGRFDSHSDSLRVQALFPKTVYSGYEIDTLRLHIAGDSSRLSYFLFFHHLKSSSVEVHRTLLYGMMEHRELGINLRIRDGQNKDQYRLSGALKMRDQGYAFQLRRDSLMLNAQNWQLPDDNLITYTPAGLQIHHFGLQNGSQALNIQSTPDSVNAPVEVSFDHFKIETLTNLASQDSLLIGGEINGKAHLDSLLTNPVFTTDLAVNDFNFKKDTVGNIRLRVNNQTANAYAAQVNIQGNGNDVSLNGTYYTAPQSNFDFTLDIRHLLMSTVDAFSFGQLTQGSGELNGSLQLKGSTDAPQVRGKVHFDSVATNITYLNSLYKMPNETITFDEKGIGFNKFTILDSMNRRATINGYAYTKDLRFYSFGLDVNARNFRALNTKQNDNQLYYGPVYIDCDIHLRGDMNVPKIDMDLRLRNKSVFTVVVPGSDPSIVDRDGVIQFVDAAHREDSAALATAAAIDSANKSSFSGLQLSANITVDTSAELDVIVDPQNGDNLKVRGDAKLNATIDPSGKISMTGRYQLVSGAYQLSFNGLIKRQFDIKQGSTITWTGEPTAADVDITAMYNVKTSAAELVSDQLSDASTEEQVTYKQKLPFELDLIMKGELLKPDISFAIDMPENSRNAFNGSVYTRLKQINRTPSELNKQVMGLLVLNHFIADDPFSSLSSGGGGASAMVRESASKILSQQLNNLASELVKGVDLNFDLQSEEDYSTGKEENRTDLNVGLSKQLFNDRTTVYVGSNVVLEGPQTPGRKASNIAGDVSIEYKLTRDGRYRIRAYRKDEYEGVVEGQVVETGASFILVMDYDHFKELFRNRRRRRQFLQRNQETTGATSREQARAATR